ncbi:hypothetical protein [Winogradskyella aurantia]|uniref:Uncharacterized protein n=1 Tax=Winogradskyella aurantia TaxID=1915063 RepID=A0A265UQK2_9FLAO|nr:hypothetical protein [Winogradskyella aurantia]OZV67585.1 hypothetical protein CA834_11585 [Winogradskyella aurantia]
MSRTKVLFVVPDGVGIKNYLYSSVLAHLKKNSDISIWSPLPHEAFNGIKDIHNVTFNYSQIELLPETPLTRLFRESASYARMLHNSRLKRNETILTNWRPQTYNLKVKILYAAAKILGNLFSRDYNRILKFEKKSTKHIPQGVINSYKTRLKECQPDVVFITHQRVAGLMPICLAAKQLNIKTSTVIFSWDNLPKARLAIRTDDYLVWSAWMKNEMMAYYPEIENQAIKIVGTPQFEFYLEEKRIISREVFARLNGLDAKKKWICFSGDDIITSPYDHLFLKDVTESLNSRKNDLQIIFRRSPVDFSKRYDDILKRSKDIVKAVDPLWNIKSQTGWVGYFPKAEDINMQVNLAYHCELVINLGSTMALDFATFDKPCLYLNYNPSNDAMWSTKTIYNFEHFKSMEDLEAVGWINQRSEILNKVELALHNPDGLAPDRKKWMEILVEHPLDSCARRIVKSLS